MNRLKFEENRDLSKFLESVLKEIYESKVQSLAIMCTMDDGSVGCGYYNCGVSTKFLYAGYLHQDALLQTLEANGLDLGDTEELEDEE